MYKYIYILICLLGVTLGTSAQGYRYQNVIQGPRGPLANVPVAVCSQPATITNAPCSPLATLYTDSTLATACNGTNGCSNPLISDGYGNVLFYAAPGKYTIQYYGPQFSAPIAYQDIVLPCDPSNCTITNGNLMVSSLNKVIYADQQAGATADVKIQACFTALSGGGICDLTGFGNTTQSIAATITVPAGVWLRGNLATKFQPAASGYDLFDISANARVSGVWVDTSNLTANSWNGNVFAFKDDYVDGQNTILSNFLITSSTQTTAGTGIFLQGSSPSQRIAFVTIRNGRIYGTNSGVFFTTSGTGWINGNTILNVQVTIGGATGNCFFVQAGGSIGVTGNLFSDDSCEQASATTGTGVGMAGTAPIRENSFTNLDIWDTTTIAPFTISNTSATGNYFEGRFDGTVTDGSGGNTFINLLTKTQKTVNALTVPLVTSSGTAATLTGTGACATLSSQKGGAWAGQATCTGTTGASTFIITPGTTAPNGWSCTASDLTTAANILRQSVSSTTACTIAGTVNANDVLTFTAIAY